VSRELGPVVPAALGEVLRGGVEAAEGFTLLVLAVADGWPHQALISVGEVLPVSSRRLLIALWPGSTVARALTPSGRAVLSAVVGETSYLLRLETERVADLSTALAGTLACFRCEVAAALADEAPYAVLESGIRFRLRDREATLSRWREVREALAAVEPPGA
jgi:hypothetical protein